jgi:glycosyltransferase involved in cell wall biosynthesis
MKTFERRLLGSADAVIVVTDGTRRRLLELHPALIPEKLHVVTNGYPEMRPHLPLAQRDPGKFTVAYVGSFQGATRGRRESLFSPGVILPSLDALGDSSVSLRVVGPVTDVQRRTIAEGPGGDLVEFTGMVTREQAIAEMAAADVSLILAEDEDWWIGRKVFESLAFAKRILALVPLSGDTAELLRGSPKATVVEPWDEAGIAAAIRASHREWQSGPLVVPPDTPNVQSDRSCAAGVAKVLESVLGIDQRASRND